MERPAIDNTVNQSLAPDYLATNQGVVGSNPAGRARIQRLGRENQVFLIAVGPLWNELSTGPVRRVEIHALGPQNQVLLLAVERIRASA